MKPNKLNKFKFLLIFLFILTIQQVKATHYIYGDFLDLEMGDKEEIVDVKKNNKEVDYDDVNNEWGFHVEIDSEGDNIDNYKKQDDNSNNYILADSKLRKSNIYPYYHGKNKFNFEKDKSKNKYPWANKVFNNSKTSPQQKDLFYRKFYHAFLNDSSDHSRLDNGVLLFIKNNFIDFFYTKEDVNIFIEKLFELKVTEDEIELMELNFPKAQSSKSNDQSYPCYEDYNFFSLLNFK